MTTPLTALRAIREMKRAATALLDTRSIIKDDPGFSLVADSLEESLTQILKIEESLLQAALNDAPAVSGEQVAEPDESFLSFTKVAVTTADDQEDLELELARRRRVQRIEGQRQKVAQLEQVLNNPKLTSSQRIEAAKALRIQRGHLSRAEKAESEFRREEERWKSKLSR